MTLHDYSSIVRTGLHLSPRFTIHGHGEKNHRSNSSVGPIGTEIVRTNTIRLRRANKYNFFVFYIKTLNGRGGDERGYSPVYAADTKKKKKLYVIFDKKSLV